MTLLLECSKRRIRCTPVHHRQAGVHQCTIGKQVYISALWAIRCTPVHYGQVGVSCSFCALERGLTNGCGHSSIYCIQQSILKIKMTCAYSDNFFNLTFYLDLLLVAGLHPAKDETSLFYYLLEVYLKNC